MYYCCSADNSIRRQTRVVLFLLLLTTENELSVCVLVLAVRVCRVVYVRGGWGYLVLDIAVA